jgi:hypothetical protein
MATTYQQRLTECLTLMSAGKGLTAIPLADRDAILVRDPHDFSPGTPTVVTIWKELPGGQGLVVYGL